MARFGHALMAEELTGMIKEADTNGSGMMNLQDWDKLEKSPILTCFSTTIYAYKRNMIFTVHVDILPHISACIT